MTLGRPKRTLEQLQTHFSQQCEMQENGCVLWLGRLDKDGYGRVRIGNKKVRVHRLALSWTGVHVPDDLVVRHTCDTPRCVNPKHLLVGTVLQNTKDCIERKRRVNVWGIEHGQCKLTAPQVLEIRSSIEDAITLAASYCVSRRTINDIRSRRRWRNLP